MNRMKWFGITAGALLCLSLARTGAAADDKPANQGQSAATDNAVNQGPSKEAVASYATPKAGDSQETANAPANPPRMAPGLGCYELDLEPIGGPVLKFCCFLGHCF